MGQRSQIYVRYNTGNGKGLIANYYGWNYGERMISRARWGIERIMASLEYALYYRNKSNVIQLSRVFDTNFEMHDYQISCDIVKEWEEEFPDENFNDYVFHKQHNNDGKLLVDIGNGIVKYAFLDCDADSSNIMDAEAYMCWNNRMGNMWRQSEYLSQETASVCEKNIAAISAMAQLMTKEEVEEFVSYDYLGDIRRCPQWPSIL